MVKNEDGNANKIYDYLCQGYSHGTDGRRLNVHQLLHRAQSLAHIYAYTEQSSRAATHIQEQQGQQTDKNKKGLMGKGLGKVLAEVVQD